MTDINLLPWRELKREREKKEFIIYFIVGLVGAIILTFLINAYANHLVTYQTSQNQILQDEISRLDRQLKEIKEVKKLREALIARMMVVQNLLSTRVMTIRLFDEIIQILPDGIYLTEIDRVGNVVTILGSSDSNSDISLLMKNIQGSEWIKNPTLTDIKRADEKNPQSVNEFKLSFTLSGQPMNKHE